jgi:hypothetical protein
MPEIWMNKEYYNQCVSDAAQAICKLFIRKKHIGLLDANAKLVGEIEEAVDKSFRG